MSTRGARRPRLIALVFLALALISSLPARGEPTERELIEAARNRNGDMTQLKELLHRGVSKDSLQAALSGAVCEGNVEAVSVLLQFGADPKYQYGKSAMGTAPWAIFCANNTDDVKRGKVTALLIQAGLSPDWVGEDNRSLLTRAVEEGDSYTAQVLLKAGASWQGVPGETTSQLTAALANRQPALARRLIAAGVRPDPEAIVQRPSGGNDRYGSAFSGMVDCNATVLGVAAQNADAESLALLLKHGKKPTPACLSGALVLATHSECGKCVTLLLNAGAHYDLNAQFSRSLSSTWFELIADSGAQVLAAYLDRGLRLNATSTDGYRRTLLYYAAAGGRADSVKWLLGHGVPAGEPYGYQSAFYAAAGAGHTEVVQMLLKAMPRIPNLALNQAKMAAAQNNHPGTVRLLAAHGAQAYIGTRLPASPYDLELKGKQQQDLTDSFYGSYSFFPPNLRFFAAYADLSRHDREPDIPIIRDYAQYAVLPDGQVIKLITLDDLMKLKLAIASPQDALSYARYLSDAGINNMPEIPARTDCLSVTQGPLKKAGVSAPRVTQQGRGKTLRFVVVRYLLPDPRPAPPGTLGGRFMGEFPQVLRATETIARDGGYAVITATVPTPGLSIRPICHAR